MQSDISKAYVESAWLSRAAWIVLGVGLLSSVALWIQTARQQEVQSTHRQQQEATALVDRLDRQLDRYIDQLASFQAMFLINGEVSRSAFHARFQDLMSQGEYPALQAVQYMPVVRHEDKADFIARVRADRSLSPDGYPDFDIHPPGERAFYLPVAYNEPMQGNERAMGHDTFFEPTRRAAMEAARDRGRPQSSAPITLMQLQGPDRLGFVVRLPVYRPGVPLDTRQARRAHYIGQVSGVFRMSEVVRQVMPDQAWRSLQWRIVDKGLQGQATAQTAPTLLFDSARLGSGHYLASDKPGDSEVHEHVLTVAGRQWALTLARPATSHLLQPYPLALLLSGLLASVALSWAVRTAATRHKMAARMAQSLSRLARHNEQDLRTVMDHTVDGIVTVAASGEILTVNQAMCRIFGRHSQAMVGQHLSLLVPAAAGAAGTGTGVGEFLLSQYSGLQGTGRRTEGQHASGRRFPLDMAISSVAIEGQTRYIGILRDLSDQAAAERVILETQRQLNEVDEMRRVIVHHAPYAIFVLNRHGVIQTVNPAGETLLGYRVGELVGHSSIQRFFDPAQVAERAHMLALRLNKPLAELDVLQHLAGETASLPTEWTLVRSDGRSLVAEISVAVLSNDHGELTGYLAMAQDVTLRRDAENQLQHLAMHDALTALPNRNMLQEQLKAMMAVAEREGHVMALMFIDLDRFKKINDGLGHHIGDSVLIEVARRLRAGMRTSDIVARLGGDEFVILLPRIAEASDGERVAQKVIELFSEPLRIGPHELRVTPSIGLVLYPSHGQDAITLMRHADLAMYQAKNNGRNRIQLYSDHMESPAADSLVLENDLYKALERQELRLHYQPQFDCATGLITGAEALLRWQHNGKLVPPGDFIPLAEESGLIVAMGEWVLREACATAQRWREATGWPLRIAVNLSAVQLDRPDIAATVARALQDTGLPPTALELEITESVVVRESLRAADILAELRSIGVSIAIDDFGVGYSSFAYLRELPVDRFKLDRSFLTSVPQSSGDSRLAAALIAMAHRLEVGIVAEGVETAAQRDFLRDHGCDEAQGYHLGRPMAEPAFEDLLREHSQQHQDVVLRSAQAAAQSTVSTAP